MNFQRVLTSNLGTLIFILIYLDHVYKVTSEIKYGNYFGIAGPRTAIVLSVAGDTPRVLSKLSEGVSA